MNSIYTKSEQTVRKYTAEDVLNRVKERMSGRQLYIDALKPFSPGHLFTLMELNELSEQIETDTDYLSQQFSTPGSNTAGIAFAQRPKANQ